MYIYSLKEIKIYSEYLNISNNKWAKLLGVSKGTVARIMNSKKT